jgi:Flp pilus assembly protein TadD
MTARSMQRYETSNDTPVHVHPRGSSRTSRPTRYLLAPALAAVAVIAVACNSGSGSDSSSASGLISQGLSAESSGQTQQAVKDFQAAVAKNPTDAIAYYDLGVIYQQNLNESTQAAAEYNKAILANPKYKPALFNLAIINTQSDPQTAVSLYNKLLTINPKDPNVLFNLGLLLISQNSSATTLLQGHEYLKQAITIDPSLASRVPKGITP